MITLDVDAGAMITVKGSWLKACGKGDLNTPFPVLRAYIKNGLTFYDIATPWNHDWTIIGDWRAIGSMFVPDLAPIGEELNSIYEIMVDESAAPLLTIESARQYVADYFAQCDTAGAVLSITGAEFDRSIFADEFECVSVKLSDGSNFTVWLEPREDGSSSLYGEW